MTAESVDVTGGEAESEVAVLHVDDDESFLSLAKSFLEEREGRFSVTSESDPGAALVRLEEESYDCLVCDYMMPALDGLSFLERVREAGHDLPFILFTGEGSEAVASEAISSGVADYLQKSVGTEQYELLANRISNAVRRDRAERRAARLERVNGVIREIDQALVRASSRRDIEQAVCDTISDSSPYRFAYVGRYEEDRGSLEFTAWAGVEVGYLDELTVTTGSEPTARGPGGQALRTGSVAVSQNIREDPAFEPWRADAVERGYRAVAGVPLSYRDELFGLLGVYADRAYAFDDSERELLSELGRDIGHAIHAVETRTRLRDSRSRYRTLVETAPDAILVAETETGRIVEANPEAERLFGYDTETLIGMRQHEFHPSEDAASYRTLFDRHVEAEKAVMTHLPNGDQILIERADGERVPVEINASVLEFEGEQRVVGVFRDISSRMERERKLRRQNERLDQFASALSHDLRSPLNVASGNLEFARENRDSEHLSAVANALERMADLVDDVLALARRGAVVDEPVPVRLEAAISGAWATTATGSASLAVDGDLGTVLADESRLVELLENLFRNAVEHGGADVTVTVERLPDGFAVRDDGPGLSPEDVDCVFQPGFSTKPDGTGFGLNIVAEIADAHGWDPVVDEAFESGARIEFRDVEFAAD